ncbi:MAG: putative immunity protein [Rhodoluna sp.]
MSFTDADHLIAAERAHAEAMEVLPIFERVEPDDPRPRRALEMLTAWMKGEATVTEVRQAAFDAHEAARDVSDESARFAARACGQAASVAHVITHAPHASRYAAKAKG